MTRPRPPRFRPHGAARLLARPLAAVIRRTPPFRGKWRLIRLWTRLAAPRGRRTRVLPGGGTVLCDLAIPYEAMVWLEQEEQADLQIVRRLLQPGQTFVDCGANIGLWSIVAAAAVSPGGTVLAFEPNPATYAKLTANMARGGWTNIHAVEAAAGAQDGVLALRCAAEHNNSRIVTAGDAHAVRVRAVRLDTLLGDAPVAGCKIDVEGFELAVLQGAEQVLRRCRPWLCVEFAPGLAGADVLERWPVHQYLTGLGYVARRFADAPAPTRQNILPPAWRPRYYCNLYYAPLEDPRRE